MLDWGLIEVSLKAVWALGLLEGLLAFPTNSDRTSDWAPDRNSNLPSAWTFDLTSDHSWTDKIRVLNGPVEIKSGFDSLKVLLSVFLAQKHLSYVEDTVSLSKKWKPMLELVMNYSISIDPIRKTK